ncbi:hypothetical protein [Leptolyngbya sp. FACHB-261]|uniref:hypothetical protein n=1 Tax=Leptolyngbya sp. FACHB-261 TaxID=2692806 RepID=UPI001685DDFD|nr:hypothetical protein [Leptolyngbya sp. FACHB-261]MBD2103030.1 hypothetical protein [Leptolyngbya sp. FACHB-261]
MMIWTPQEMIGRRVWLEIEDPPRRVQAEIEQPTSPPWFFARFLEPTRTGTGLWMSLREVELALLDAEVLEEDELEPTEALDDFDFDELTPPRYTHGNYNY